MKLWNLVLVAALALTGVHAEAAKRLGGGGSFGKQSSNVTQRQATPAPSQAPAQSAGTAQSANKPVAPAPAQPAKRPWGAMLGGLAAGLGLAWLASSLGLGEGLANLMTMLLVAGLVFMAIAWFMRRKAAGSASQGGLAMQGAGNVPFSVSQPYNPKNVGNDASARPWERNTTSFQAQSTPENGGSMIGSALAGSQNWGVPAGFDTDGFLKAAKTNFINLQAAWDKSDIATLRAMMTDDMTAEIKGQLAEREKLPGASVNLTEVVMLDAHLLGIEELDSEYMASVEFSGMIREEAGTSPNPFREVWNMTKPKVGGGWLVAGVQALQ